MGFFSQRRAEDVRSTAAQDEASVVQVIRSRFVRSPLSLHRPAVAVADPPNPRGHSQYGKSKGKERERDERPGRECVLREFRRFGRWDGWG